MSITPVYKNDTPVFHNTFSDDDGNIISLVGLSASNLTMHFIDKNGIPRAGSGTWTITSSANGTADYQTSTADTGTPGPTLAYPVVQLTTGPRHFDPVSILIIDIP